MRYYAVLNNDVTQPMNQADVIASSDSFVECLDQAAVITGYTRVPNTVAPYLIISGSWLDR